MALQRKGGRGNRSVLDVVMRMREGGTSEEGIRREPRQQGYKAPRIHQLLKATLAGKHQGGRDKRDALDMVVQMREGNASEEGEETFH